MLMLDGTPLGASHFIFLLSSFIGVYGMCTALVRTKRVVYVGTGIVGTAAVLSGLILDRSLFFGLAAASVIIAICGMRDERVSLSPGVQLMLQMAAVALVVLSGWTMPYVTNPFGEGVLSLSWITYGSVLIPGSIIAGCWLLLTINAMNWIDGIDGLAGSVALVSFLAIATISLLPSIQNADTLALALIGAGCMAGFLIWNISPARVYLGTTGSWFVGLYIGLVAMHGGGKMATAALILALPVLDALYVVYRRMRAGASVWHGDTTNHIHHRLTAAGFSSNAIVAGAVGVTLMLSVVGIFLPTPVKLLVLVAFAILFVVLSSVTSYRNATHE